MKDYFANCNLCPRNCGSNRTINNLGFCQMGSSLKVSLASVHFYEEPPISGTNGSGTIFFSGCHLKCIFCQNYSISNEGFGKEITVERLSEIFLEQQLRNVHNINLVSATHFTPLVCRAIKLAKNNGLYLPIVWNSSGYESIETLKMLEGLVDIYLPDIKYFDSNMAIEYSKAPNYFNIATDALSEMMKQIGEAKFDENGIMKKGVIIRHLVLPSSRKDSIKIIEKLAEKFGTEIYLSILNQYTPIYNACQHPVLKRKLTTFEYNSVVDRCIELGFNNVFIQKKSSQSSKFTPHFDLKGV